MFVYQRVQFCGQPEQQFCSKSVIKVLDSRTNAPGEVGRLASRDLDGIAQQGSPAAIFPEESMNEHHWTSTKYHKVSTMNIQTDDPIESNRHWNQATDEILQASNLERCQVHRRPRLALGIPWFWELLFGRLEVRCRFLVGLRGSCSTTVWSCA